MKFLKKNWFNILFILFLVIILLNPLGIGTSIKSFVIKATSFSPSVIVKEDRVRLNNYNWNLMNINGESFDFNQTKGEVVFVSFWTTWCPPCVAEIPSIQALYDEYGDKVTFVLVSDEKPSKIKAFLKKHNYTLPIYSNVSTSPKEFESSSIPVSFVLDKEGSIVIKKKGAADWDSKKTKKIINDLLKQ